ncbi:MAG: acylating sulfoacetaldehyde dehydrogenase [Paracoccaceae bacterium]
MTPTDENLFEVDTIMLRAKEAQNKFEQNGCQDIYDRAAFAAGWAIIEPKRNEALAKLAVKTTGLGNVADKITKNHRKTLGLLRDIKGAATHGVIAHDIPSGITEIARPLGVIGAVVPSTNPAATPANNVINALKCGNAIVLAPSPKGAETCSLLLKYIHAEFDKIGLSHDLVQMLPVPGSKAKTQRMMELSDLIVVTGSQDNVRRGYSSGRPSLGVGAGNATVIIDETADLADAAAKISASKTFDNATSCSSENAVICVDAVYDKFTEALTNSGGAIVSNEQQVIAELWSNGTLNRGVIAQDADKMIEALNLQETVPASTKFLVVETQGVGPDHPLSGEKLSRVLALYRASDFEHAVKKASEILNYQGAGHSVGLHSTDDSRAISLGNHLPTCRVIVNQAHCFATGGSFDNGMPFSLSMGCGSWGGNSIAENLNWRHFFQTTKIVRPIEARIPALDDIFEDYWSVVGR